MSTSRYTAAGMMAMMKVLNGQERIDYAYKHADTINFNDFQYLHNLLMLFQSESDEAAFLVAHKNRLSTADWNDTNRSEFIKIIFLTASHCSEVIPAFNGWLKNIEFDHLIKNLLPYLPKRIGNSPDKGTKEAAQAISMFTYYIAKACMDKVTDNEKLATIMGHLSNNRAKVAINRFTYQKEVEAHWEELGKKATLQQSASSAGSPTMFALRARDKDLHRPNSCDEDQQMSSRPNY